MTVLKEDLEGAISKIFNKEFVNHGIKEFYKEKRLALKNHYDKIKAAIKVSFEKDLEELEKRKTRSL